MGGVSSSFMLADARPVPKSVPSIRNVSPTAANNVILQPTFGRPGETATSTGRHQFRTGTNPAAYQAMDEEDCAPELGPSAHNPGHSGTFLGALTVLTCSQDVVHA